MSVKLAIIILIPLWFTACASQRVDLTGSSVATATTSNSTALQHFNRDAYVFNKSIDTGIIKPLAKGYKKITPEFINIGVSNVFSNLSDVPNALNALLQFKPKDAATDTGRFVINSSLGLAGFFDVATKIKLQKHHEDFGQTLAVWGVPSGEYIMLPVLGPSTMRDGVGKVVDSMTNPYSFFENSLAYSALDKVDKRASLLSKESVLYDFSDDEYKGLRTAWLQRRRHLINDGRLDQQAVEDKASLIDELEDLE
jgi:phospholipid-binding lipoprotein MlaA